MIVGKGDFLHPAEEAKFRELLLEYEEIFAFDNSDLGLLNPEIEPPVFIHTVPHEPWQSRQMKLSEEQRKVATAMVKDRIASGLMEPCMGPYRNQFFLVPKKDGRYRLICDLQPCNKVTIKDAAVPPNTDELSQALAGAVCYSGCDCFSGYNGIGLDELSRDLTAIMTPLGLIRYTRLPEGWTNSVAIFQRILTKILRYWVGKNVWIFIDDFGIKGPTSFYEHRTNEDGIRIWVEEHIKDLRGIFNAIRNSGLTLSGLKCFFCVPELEMLSFVCTKDGRRPAPKKLQKIWDWKPCTNLKEARGFVGLCVCFRKWIQGFMGIMSPIYELQKKNAIFVWGDRQQEAMNTIKSKFTEELILISPNFDPGAPMMVLTTDGGPDGWGAVLHQENADGVLKPIEFESGFFNDTEKRYDQLKREALALCKALRKLKYYVHGRRFKVETDAASLVWLLNQVPSDLPNAVMTRWLTWLRLFDFETKHIKGKTNIIADSLSRKPYDGENDDETDFEEYLDTEDGTITKVGGRGETPKSQKPKICRMFQESDDNSTDYMFREELYETEMLAMGIYKTTLKVPEAFTPAQSRAFKAKSQRYIVKEGYLFETISPGGRTHGVPKRVVGNKSSKLKILQECHDRLLHRGREATYKQIAEKYVWKSMFADVERYVATCDECQKRSRLRNSGLLHPQYTEGIFSRVNIDTVKIGQSSMERTTRTTNAGNCNQIIVARDDLSGWVEARAISDGTASTVAKFFIEEVIYRHGVPYKVVADGGSEFMKEFKLLLSDFHIKHITISAYHPESAGMIERGHKPLMDALAKRCLGDPTEWPKHLHAALWADRVTTKRTTKMTPFFMIYGRHSILPINLLEESWDLLEWDKVKTTSDLLEARMRQIEYSEEMRGVGRLRVNESRERSVEDQSLKRNLRPESKELKSGDLVLLHNTEKERQYGEKLRFYWRGPYRLLRTAEQRSWRLVELDGTDMKGTYNEDRLKKYERRIEKESLARTQPFCVEIITDNQRSGNSPLSESI